MKVVTLPTQVLHEFHQIITNELKEKEKHTSLLSVQVEKNRASLKKELNQSIKEMDEEH